MVGDSLSTLSLVCLKDEDIRSPREHSTLLTSTAQVSAPWTSIHIKDLSRQAKNTIPQPWNDTTAYSMKYIYH